jgi:hypothetical protein
MTHNKAEVKVDRLQHNRGMHIIQNPFEVNLSIFQFKIRHDHKWSYQNPIQTSNRTQVKSFIVFMLFLQDTLPKVSE